MPTRGGCGVPCWTDSFGGRERAPVARLFDRASRFNGKQPAEARLEFVFVEPGAEAESAEAFTERSDLGFVLAVMAEKDVVFSWLGTGE